MNIVHPLIDSWDEVAIVTENRAPVAYLSSARADLLLRAVANGRRVILVSDELTTLTYPMRELLQDTGGRWVVREPAGTLRDGLDGRRLDVITDAVTKPPLTTGSEASERYLRSEPAEVVQLVISQSVRHKASDTTVLGGTVELFARQFTGARPVGWGAHEPAVVAWDRERLTELCRNRSPEDTTVVVTGSAEHPMTGMIRTARTAEGLEETTQLIIGSGAPGSDEARAVVDRLPGLFADLALRPVPLFGLVMARTGRRDLTLPPVLEAPPTPLGMFLGPPGVRELRLDIADLGARLGARVVGRPRFPGLYFPLGTFEIPGWPALDAVLDAIGRDRVKAALGSAGGPIGGALHAPRP